MFPGLSGTVTVTEDQYGIPTIKGENELDVIFVQGYLHARDRFFQMDITRKTVAGRVSELVGEAGLSSDIEFRGIGLGRSATKTLAALEAETKAWLQAYSNGVNTWIANNPLPPEYVGLELTKTDMWTPLDSVLVGKGLAGSLSLDLSDIDRTINYLAYNVAGEVAGIDGQALFFEDTHRSAPADDRFTAPEFLAAMSAAAEQSIEASGYTGSEKLQIKVENKISVSESALGELENVQNRLKNAPFIKPFMQNSESPNGSNAWLVAGEHTESGNAMIANDPHLGLNTPAQWYEAHLVFPRDGEEWHVNGVTLAGAPGVVLGCNNVGCWGATVNPLDVTDVYTEEFPIKALGLLPTHTSYKGTPEPMQYVFNSFFVNAIGDEAPDTLVRAPVGYTQGAITPIVPRRNDGPIISLDLGLSLAYTGSRDSHDLTMFRKADLARNVEEFEEALTYFDTAIQNMYWADVNGNIAWFTTSEKPLREDLAAFAVDGAPPWLIRDGTGEAANEWQPVMNPQPNQALDYEILPAEEMPHLVNPDKGFVNNANNDPVGTTADNNPVNQVRPSGSGLYYLNAGYVSYRMGRLDREIKALIDAGQKVTMDDFKRIQANAQMLDAELVMPTLMAIMSQVPVPPESPMAQALEILSTWDYTANTGIAEGYDAGDDPMTATEPTEDEMRSAAAATVWAAWRSMLVQNTIYATLSAAGLGDYLPSSRLAYNAFKHHLENYPTAGGVGASGVPFFSAGLAETVAGSLQMALDLLASDEFAPAFANSTNVMDYAWGKLHRIKFDHPLNTDPLNIPNGGGFSDLSAELPGISRQGGYEVLDASGHSATADGLNEFMFGSGPSRRFVADMAPGGVDAQQVIAGGQSGLFYHPNYSSQLPLWLTNNYHQMALTTEDANGVAVMEYTFGPPQPAPAAEEENNND